MRKVFTLLAACFLFLQGGVAQTNKPQYELVKDWLQFPNNFNLSIVSAVAVDGDQNIIFFQRTGRTWTDPFPDSLISSNTIFIIDKHTGKILSGWGADYFIMPHGLTVDKQNNVWVTDVGLQQIFKFSHEGKLLMKIGVEKVWGNDSTHFSLPTDVAVADDGSFYVSDGYGNSRIIKFDRAGRYLFEWGTKGTGEGQFDIPHSLTLDTDNNVYVADRQNNRIQKFDAKGKFIKEWKNNEADILYAVTTNTKDELFAVDDMFATDSISTGKEGVVKLNSNLDLPVRSERYDGIYHDIAIDKEGNIYVADVMVRRVQKFRKILRKK